MLKSSVRERRNNRYSLWVLCFLTPPEVRSLIFHFLLYTHPFPYAIFFSSYWWHLNVRMVRNGKLRVWWQIHPGLSILVLTPKVPGTPLSSGQTRINTLSEPMRNHYSGNHGFCLHWETMEKPVWTEVFSYQQIPSFTVKQSSWGSVKKLEHTSWRRNNINDEEDKEQADKEEEEKESQLVFM